MICPRLEIYLCLFPDLECSLVLLGPFLPCRKHQWSTKAWNNVWKAGESGRKGGRDYMRKGRWERHRTGIGKEGRREVLELSQFTCFPSFSNLRKETLPEHLSLLHGCCSPSPSPRALPRLRAWPLAQKAQKVVRQFWEAGDIFLFLAVPQRNNTGCTLPLCPCSVAGMTPQGQVQSLF